MNAGDIIESAKNVVSGDRQRDYGHPKANHSCTAAMWKAWIARKHGVLLKIDENDVCWMNIMQKISREANSHKDDNWVDVVGYVLNDAMCKEANDECDQESEAPRLCIDCGRATESPATFCLDCTISNNKRHWVARES